MSKLYLWVLIVSIASILTGISYAWLSTYYESEKGITVDTAGAKPIPVHVWIYNTTEDVKEVASVQIGAGWMEITHAEDTEETVKLTSILTKNGVSAYKFDVRGLHFGRINNLVTLTEDNVVYARFDINRIDHGSEIVLDIVAPDNYIKVFNQSGTELPEGVLTSLTNSESKSGSHLRYEYAVSNVSAIPGTDSFDALTWAGELPGATSINQDGNTTVELNKYHLEQNLAAGLGQANDYYLYLRITPNLRTLSRSASALTSYMPCQMTFDWEWELSVKPNQLTH